MDVIDKQELIDKYRDINVDHDWWDFTYEDFTKDMLDKGIDVDQIWFSGFWSQGDGACFTGTIFVDNFKKFMEVHDLRKEYPATYFFAELGEIGVVIRQSGRYLHENTMSISINEDAYNPYEEEDGLRYETYDTMLSLFNDEFSNLEQEVSEICRDHARDLYRRLEKEYEHLTSDELVWDTIEANDLHLQHEGE